MKRQLHTTYGDMDVIAIACLLGAWANKRWSCNFPQLRFGNTQTYTVSEHWQSWLVCLDIIENYLVRFRPYLLFDNFKTTSPHKELNY
jgi:hypothetical protein